MNFKAIIFDVDGTLAETEEMHRRAFNEIFEVHGLDWHWDVAMYGELLKTTGGKERMMAYQGKYCAEDAQIPFDDIAAMHKEKTARYGELIASGALDLRPGIRELIEDAGKNSIRLAVATTTNIPNVEVLTEACFGKAAGEVFEVIAAGDEVANKKPAPDVFKLAVKRLELAPEECVGLEDSRNGLLSCTGAGVPCVVSPDHYTMGQDFSEASAAVGCFSEVDTIEKLARVMSGTTS